MGDDSKFGIGMSQRQASNFYREIVMILIVFPIIIITGALAISQTLESILEVNMNIFKYILMGIGGVSWIIVLYKKYIQKIIKSI